MMDVSKACKGLNLILHMTQLLTVRYQANFVGRAIL